MRRSAEVPCDGCRRRCKCPCGCAYHSHRKVCTECADTPVVAAVRELEPGTLEVPMAFLWAFG